MRLPTICGVIERRILANYRIDPAVVAAVLPAPFRPKLFEGYAVGGICLIRLRKVRPKLLTLPWGMSSENAAHRIAVEWDAGSETKQGVYVPRRDTNSLFNSIAGGRLFPGTQHHARFSVEESDPRFSVSVNSDDGKVKISVRGSIASKLPSSSMFGSLPVASEFFRLGSLGYSATPSHDRFDGIELNCESWHVEPLDVATIQSSYFDDQNRFPSGSIEFDCALLMRNIDHQWHSRPDICCAASGES